MMSVEALLFLKEGVGSFHNDKYNDHNNNEGKKDDRKGTESVLLEPSHEKTDILLTATHLEIDQIGPQAPSWLRLWSTLV